MSEKLENLRSSAELSRFFVKNIYVVFVRSKARVKTLIEKRESVIFDDVKVLFTLLHPFLPLCWRRGLAIGARRPSRGGFVKSPSMNKAWESICHGRKS